MVFLELFFVTFVPLYGTVYFFYSDVCKTALKYGKEKNSYNCKKGSQPTIQEVDIVERIFFGIAGTRKSLK